MSTPLDRDNVARLIYEAEERIRYGHVRTPWEKRQHGAYKQHLRKVAELIDFSEHDVLPRLEEDS